VAGAGCGSDTSSRADGVAPARTATGPHAVVWAVGDGADGGSAAAGVVRMIRRTHPDRLLYLGDVYEAGTAADYASNYARSWGRLAKITAPTPGNHEWADRAQGYDAYWSKVRGHAQPPWYSIRVAGWKLLSLNSETDHGDGSPQVRWLQRATQGSGNCRIAFWHRARFSAGLHGDQADTQPLWEPLEGKARIALWGHDHDMQRLRPRAGIVSFVSGSGGHDLYPVLPFDKRVAFSNQSRYGALRLDLERGLARYRFVDSRGRTLDSGRVRCSRGKR
jgi:hypothetical protein